MLKRHSSVAVHFCEVATTGLLMAMFLNLAHGHLGTAFACWCLAATWFVADQAVKRRWQSSTVRPHMFRDEAIFLTVPAIILAGLVIAISWRDPLRVFETLCFLVVWVLVVASPASNDRKSGG